MSELNMDAVEFIPVQETAERLETWLSEEVVSSGEGRNSILDDWGLYQEGLEKPFHEPSNAFAGKARGHYDRLRNWTLGFELDSGLLHDEYYMARQKFCAQIEISGAFRRQCFVESWDPGEYKTRRFEHGPAGIDLEKCIAERLDEYTAWKQLIPGAAFQQNPAARLIANTNKVNDEYLQIVETVQGIAIRDAGQENSAAANYLKRAQKIWTGLFVDYTMFDINVTGTPLEKIAFLEPKSISDDPQVYYPFSKS